MVKLLHLKLPNNRPCHEKYRHELKYLISVGEWELIRSRMNGVFEKDNHTINGQYFIRSLYFDDYWNTAYNQKNEGLLERYKYRIRIYNLDDNIIKLERKKKYDNYINKQSASISREQFEMILNGDYDFLLESKHPLLKDMYVECKSNLLRPRVIVDYDREPWMLEAGDTRITFDMNIRASVGSNDIFDGDLPSIPCLDNGMLVMEVKYTEFLPQIVRELIPPSAADISAVSKYVLCYDKTSYLREPLYWEDGESAINDTTSLLNKR